VIHATAITRPYTVGFASSNWVRIKVDGLDERAIGASLYYRGALVANELRARGFGGWIGSVWRPNADGSIEVMDHVDGTWHTPDVLWCQQWFATELVEQTRRARASGQVVVCDIDDHYWSMPETNEAHKIWARQPEQISYFEHMAACDAIITSTETLAYRASRLGPPVFLARNPVDSQWLTPHDPSDGQVGWIGSTPWRAHDLELFRDAKLDHWLKRRGQRFYHGGAMVPPELTPAQRAVGARYRPFPSLSHLSGIDPSLVDEAPNVPFVDYPHLWDRVGVSLVPLEPVAFNRGKSWLKSLESCAVGVPYIVSAGFTEQDALIEEGSRGRTWSKPRELLDHLDALMDPVVRRSEGADNRRVAERNDVRLRFVEWLAVFDQLVATRAGLEDVSFSS
jgi:hypothetical protein